MARIALIDADIVAYAAAVSNEGYIDWGDTGDSFWTDPQLARELADDFMAAILKESKTTETLIAFSSGRNFRFGVLPTYKHNRKDIAKPALLQEIQKYLKTAYPTVEIPTLEGDDVIGIYATLEPSKYVICSIDKDLLQIPGVHYNWRKQLKTKVNRKDGDLWFYRQVLTGDTTDGYKGCPGIGAKKAVGILEPFSGADKLDHKGIWQVIVATYESKGLTERDALQQARVAKILQKENYCFENKEIRLWDISLAV